MKWILDNLLLGTLENIKHLIDRNQIRFIEEDLLNFDKVCIIMTEEKFDRVYHLAANSDISQGDVAFIPNSCNLDP